jgi:large subunit ribosomal protein L18
MKRTSAQISQRQRRVRKELRSNSDRIRLSVHRSNVAIYAQLIDDTKRVTIVGVSEAHIKADKKMTKTEKAKLLGLELAKQAKEHKISMVSFDKGAYRYHGRVKALADGAREGGLVF